MPDLRCNTSRIRMKLRMATGESALNQMRIVCGTWEVRDRAMPRSSAGAVQRIVRLA